MAFPRALVTRGELAHARRVRAWAVAGLLALASCLPQQELTLEPGFASAVVFVVERAQLRARVYDLEGGLQPTSIATADGAAFVLLYREPLSRWAIEAGDLEPADAATGRALPPADRALAFDGIWSEVGTLPPAISEFRFKAPSAEECAARGGCWESPEKAFCVDCPRPEEPAAPSPPAPPDLAACAPGWRPVQDGALMRCDPAVPDAETCARDELALPSEGCTPLGSACPSAEPWPVGLPAGTPLFVRAGASGGDGTRQRPFGSIAEAIAVAPRGAVVALARGRYTADEIGEVTLFGACVSGTTLSSAMMIAATASIANLTAEASLLIQGTSARLALQDVALAGDGRVSVAPGAAVFARRLSVYSGTTAPMITVDGGALSLEASVLTRAAVAVTGGRMAMSDVRLHGEGARALLDHASVLIADDVVLDRAGGAEAHRAEAGFSALGLRGGSRAVVTDLWARSSTMPIDAVSSGLELSRAWIEASTGDGVFLVTSSATISDLVVRGVRTRGELTGGVFASAGCLRLERAAIERVEGPGVAITGSDGRCSRLSDLESRDAVRRSLRNTGRHEDPHGLLIRGSDVELSRLRLTGNDDSGLFIEYFASGPLMTPRESDVTAADLIAHGNQRTGLKLEQRTHLRGARIEIRENLGAGIYLKPEESSLQLVELRVEGAVARGDCGAFATDCLPAGLRANSGALFGGGTVRITRFVVAGNDEHGVAFSDNVDVQLTHGLITGHRVGARLIGAETPISSVLVGVSYRDNVRNIVRGVE